MTRPLPALALALLVAACGGRAAAPATGAPEAPVLRIIGTLTYEARVALPPGAEAVVALQPTRDGGRAIAERRMPLDGREMPVVFELPVERARLDSTGTHWLVAAIMEGGRPRWASDPVRVDASGRGADVGTLVLQPWVAAGFRSTLRCGDRAATIGFRDDLAVLIVDGEAFELPQAPAASGARFVSATDPGTWLWTKGDTTRVAVRGTDFPPCVDAAAPATWRAGGNEPFWGVELSGDRLTFTEPGAEPLVFPRATTRAEGDGRRITATAGGRAIEVEVVAARCVDDMSGMTRPETVRVRLDARALAGCGGDPAAVLVGAEWVVEDIGGGGIIDNSRVTVTFGPAGELYGRAGCNTFTGRHALTGEGLTASRVATTAKACAPSLMAQEARVLELLRGVQRFSFAPDGALLLHAADGRTLRARR
jgi:heat shock protein HslJ/uncharacterized lipoprotein YbaY